MFSLYLCVNYSQVHKKLIYIEEIIKYSFLFFIDLFCFCFFYMNTTFSLLNRHAWCLCLFWVVRGWRQTSPVFFLFSWSGYLTQGRHNTQRMLSPAAAVSPSYCGPLLALCWGRRPKSQPPRRSVKLSANRRGLWVRD